MSTALTTLTTQLASKLDIGVDGAELITTLKATAFKGQVTDAQMMALLVVANQYCLNPWTKEIYAFPDKNNGIIPVVGVDGWSRIINSSDQFDGMEFEQDNESCTCKIYRKDRSHPISVTEYMSECKRGNAGPWQSHPKRMLRHKAMIQCARLAFGYVGIYDQDEAERITEKDMGVAHVVVDPVDLDEWLQKVALCESQQKLTEIWTAGVSAFKSAGDVTGYNQLKAAVTARANRLNAPAAEDVA